MIFMDLGAVVRGASIYRFGSRNGITTLCVIILGVIHDMRCIGINIYDSAIFFCVWNLYLSILGIIANQVKGVVQHKHVSNASIEDDIICDKDAKDRLKFIFKCVDASTILHNLYSSLRQNILLFHLNYKICVDQRLIA